MGAGGLTPRSIHFTSGKETCWAPQAPLAPRAPLAPQAPQQVTKGAEHLAVT